MPQCDPLADVHAGRVA